MHQLPMYYIHITCNRDEFLHQTYTVHVLQLCMLLFIHLCQARDTLISIGVALATNVFLYCMYIYVYIENIEHCACIGDKNDTM